MASLKTGPTTPGLHLLAIPAVCLLILFQAYFSQWLFYTSPDLDPGRLTTRESVTFNSLLLCLWWTYYRACSVDPGTYPPVIPTTTANNNNNNPSSTSALSDAEPPTRWCKKCRQPKPRRAHHCRHCRRCVPKMDHHCPWTGNCVSLQTFPHFLRFLVFTNLSLWALARLLYLRFAALWSSRHLPAYLGPSVVQLAALTLLALTCAATSLALGIMLVTTVKGWVFNMTMIEGWEAERHEALLERRRREGYYYEGENEDEEDDEDDDEDADDGLGLLHRVEFPYDLGFFENMAQAMGTRNVVLWFFPLAGGPRVNPTGAGVGWTWEENGFNPSEGMWPPPDPERLRHARRGWPAAAAARMAAGTPGYAFREGATAEETKAEFRRRQEDDVLRRRAKIMAELEEVDGGTYDAEYEGNGHDDYEEGMDGEPGWTNSDGDRLRDYGVDEEVEEEDFVPADPDDDVPIAELLRRRKVVTRDDYDQ